MKKADLIAKITEKSGLNKSEVENVFDKTFETIIELMKQQEKVMIPGFGGFTLKVRKERKGRNPATGAEMIIPKSNVANFKPATQLKEILNQD